MRLPGKVGPRPQNNGLIRYASGRLPYGQRKKRRESGAPFNFVIHSDANGVCRKTLAPANEARDLIVTDISLQKGSKLSRLINRKKIRETTKILSATEIEEVDDEMLQRQIKEEMDLAESQQRQWEYKNSTSNTVISFINDFVEFVGEFSGIIEIMKGVDQGYGGAGYAALSFLLGVHIQHDFLPTLYSDTGIRWP